MSGGISRGILWDVVILLLLTIVFAVRSDDDFDTDIENMLETILDPREPTSLQTQALRNDLIRRVKDALKREELENQLVDYKRSLSSLARWRNLPNKRNLQSLARAGYIRTLPDENDDNKRGIESLARNGDLHRKRENQQNLYDDYSKRNVASLARNYNFPTYSKRFIYEIGSNLDKRNIAALAREGMKINGKRNVAALLRQDSYLNGARYGRDESQTQKPDDHFDDKRNIASVKAQYKPKFKRSADISMRQRRDADYYDFQNDEYPTFYQNDPLDYEDMLRSAAEEYENPEKRFLGSVAKTGWFRPSKFVTPSKRHIGSLARLGWLPSFRSARRFNRSGRSSNSCDTRSSTADGEIEDNSIPQDPFELDDKRFLIQPAVDKILLQKVYMHPKSK